MLLDAATAYMNLLRDRGHPRTQSPQRRSSYRAAQTDARSLQCRRSDAHGRCTIESRLAAGRSGLLGAQSNYVTSQANYRRVIGVDPGGSPRHAGRPAVATYPSQSDRPGSGAQSLRFFAAMYGVDVRPSLRSKSAKGRSTRTWRLAASASYGTQPAFETVKETQNFSSWGS